MITPKPDDTTIPDMSAPKDQNVIQTPDMVDITLPKELLAQLASIFQMPEGQDGGDSVSIQIPKSDLDQLVEILQAASTKAGADIENGEQGGDLSGLGDELSGMRGAMNR